MTNYEHLKNLTTEEMAWFLMAYSDPCRTCIFKTMDYLNESHKERNLLSIKCAKKPDDKTSCIEGTEMWLNRETMADDDDMFVMTACKRNVEVGRRNKILIKEEEKRKREQAELWMCEVD